MAIDIVRGAIKNQIASADLIETINGVQNEYTGTLFLAYPLSATAESVVTIDALLVTKEKGIIAFIFDSGAEREEQQDSLYYQITNTLNNYETLRKGRRLAVEPNVITYCVEFEVPECSDEYIYASRDNLKEILENSIGNFDSNYYEELIEALQKISTMKPKKQRRNVVKESSRGAIMKNIEKQIANLDQWQKKLHLRCQKDLSVSEGWRDLERLLCWPLRLHIYMHNIQTGTLLLHIIHVRYRSNLAK